MPRELRLLILAMLLVPSCRGALGLVVGLGDITPSQPTDWNTDTDAVIGATGSAILRANSGSRFEVGNAVIGLLPGGVGVVAIDGASTRWTVGNDLIVGQSGFAQLLVSADATLVVGGELAVGLGAGGAGQLGLATGGVLALQGDADDSIEQFLSQVQGGGDVSYYDEGAAGFVPITGATRGDDYTLEFQTSGELAGFTLLAVDAFASPPGDFDGDHDVDLDDYQTWRENFGGSVFQGTGPDANNDGAVDAADYTIWRDNYQQPQAATRVPEPAALTPALALLAFCWGRRAWSHKSRTPGATR